MKQLKELQTAFFDMMGVIDAGAALVITVFPDGDPRVHGFEWVQDGDVIFMSDPLYGLYCADCGMENMNYRGEKQS